jgi:3-oxoacyl-[acyl-carrier protein] reductase
MADQKEFSGKTALVTGSGRNLGRATILEFAQRGADVVVCAHSRPEEAEAVAAEAAEFGVRAMAVTGDTSDPETALRWQREVADQLGAVDILVSNAAVRRFQNFFDTTVEDWDQTIRLNLSSSFYLTKAFVPAMREKGWGRVILVSGLDGFMGASHRVHNVTAKAGLHGLTKALAIELGQYGITVNTLGTGVFNTTRDEVNYPANMAQESYRVYPNILTGRRGEPEEFAYAVAFLASPRSGYITGAALHVNGGQVLI